MRDFEDKFVQMINKYNKLDNLSIEFVPGVKVTHIDAHLIALMSKNPHKKASELAELFGVTKGAVSQQIKKLEKKGLVSRVRLNDNYREVYIELTELGEQVVEAHYKFHDVLFGELVKEFGGLTEEQGKFFNFVLDKIINLFDRAEDILEKVK